MKLCVQFVVWKLYTYIFDNVYDSYYVAWKQAIKNYISDDSTRYTCVTSNVTFIYQLVEVGSMLIKVLVVKKNLLRILMTMTIVRYKVKLQPFSKALAITQANISNAVRKWKYLLTTTFINFLASFCVLFTMTFKVLEVVCKCLRLRIIVALECMQWEIFIITYVSKLQILRFYSEKWSF